LLSIKLPTMKSKILKPFLPHGKSKSIRYTKGS